MKMPFLTLIKRGMLLCVAVSLCLVSCNKDESESPRQNSDSPEGYVNWDYPVKPGSAEWSNFKTSQEMAEACLIPAGVLSKMPTEELIYVCLRYPLLGDLSISVNLQQGINAQRGSFNGLNELFKRKDASSLLLEIYKNEEPKNAEGSSFAEYYSLFFIEAFLSQEEILSKYQDKEIAELVSLILSKIEGRENEGHSVHSLTAGVYLLAKIMYNEGYGDIASNEVLLNFAQNGTTLTEENVRYIIELAKSFVSVS